MTTLEHEFINLTMEETLNTTTKTAIALKNMKYKIGDYVVATKYSDGDSKDHFCVGIYNGTTEHTPQRYDIVDSDGKSYRGNGFRRIRKVRQDVGQKIIDNLKNIEQSDRSVWSWVRQFERNYYSGS